MRSVSKASADETIVQMPVESEALAFASARKKPGPKPGSKRTKKARRGKLTKSGAVAMCVESLGREQAKLEDIHQLLRQRFKIKLKSTTISQYKSMYLKHLREGGEPFTMPSESGFKATRSTFADSGTVSIDEIRDIKALMNRMGAERFREFVDLILS